MDPKAVVCRCGKRLRKPVGAAGKKILCPGCKAPVSFEEGFAGPDPVSVPDRHTPGFNDQRPAPSPLSVSEGRIALHHPLTYLAVRVVAWMLLCVIMAFRFTSPSAQPIAPGRVEPTSSTAATPKLIQSPTEESRPNGPKRDPAHIEQARNTAKSSEAMDLVEQERQAMEKVDDLGNRGRWGEVLSLLGVLRNPIAKARRAILIHDFDSEFRSMGVTSFNRTEAERLASEALPAIEEMAETDPVASRVLGVMFVRGIGVPKRPDLAFHRFLFAAERGDSSAMRNVGYCYLDGVGAPKKDGRLAIQWVEKATKLNNLIALYDLGRFYANGEAVEKDREKAISYLQESAEAGYVEAMRGYCQLSLDLAKEALEAKDFDKATKYFLDRKMWLTEAANAGSAEAMWKLGSNERTSLFGASEVGFRWIKRAAKSGLSGPMLALAG